MTVSLKTELTERAASAPVARERSGRLLLVLCAATFMSTLDLFIVNVGLRSIGRSVGETSLSNLSWILNGYAIVFAALLVPAGRIADRFGNKQVFSFGLAMFSLASLGCALSSNLWLIVGMRGLQAVGAAALVPTSLGLILTGMPAAKVKQSIQLWSVFGSLGAAAGPAIGGVLVESSWRWIFILNVPIGLAALVGAIMLAPNTKHSDETAMPDLLGGLLLILGVGALTLALVKGSDWGWSSARVLLAAAITVVTLALFVVRTTRHASPIVHAHLFRDRAFTWATTSMTLMQVGFGLSLLAGVLWLQEGWGWSPVKTGLGIAPGPVMVSVTALGLRRWTARFDADVLSAVGTALIGLGGLVVGLRIGAHPDYVSEFLPGWLIIGAGVGFCGPNLVAGGTAKLAPKYTSTGSAVIQMGRQLGTALGVAVLIVVLGSAPITGASHDRFLHAFTWAGGLGLLASVAALQMRPRRVVRH